MPKKILIIDDDPVVVNYLKAVFSDNGYAICRASSSMEGLDGVKKVKSGWKNFKEINTVYYDSAGITIDKMERALKAAGTYRGTAEVYEPE